MVYWITIWLLRAFFLLFTKFDRTGSEHVPSSGGFVLVSNHISHFDPPAFSAACRRAVDWMGSQVIFFNRITQWYFTACNVIKVRQYEADQGALREAIRRVRQGRGVGLFPEGGIRAGEKSILGSSFELYEGAFMIAMLGRVPIIPCLVIGTDRLYEPRHLKHRPPVWVKMGKPIWPEGKGKEAIAGLRDQTIRAIQGLAQELRESQKIQPEDWPQSPQQRNPKIKPAQDQLPRRNSSL
jgi:1-acyl-sn-glycerol-3-phosphate acyltransferase